MAQIIQVMFDLSYRDLNNNEFRNAFDKLTRAKSIDIKVKHKIITLSKALRAEAQNLDDAREALVDDAMEMDPETGLNKTDDEGNIVYKNGYNKKTMNDEFDKLLDTVAQIPAPQVKLKDLEFALDRGELDMADIVALDPVII